MLLRSITRSPIIVRGFATHAPATPLPAILHLKTGESFKGTAFGSPRSIWGETVFSTSITSCELIVFIFWLYCTLTFTQTPSP